MKPEIEIHIDSLALHGFSTFDPGSFSTALSGELTRLLADGSPRPGAWRVEAVQIDLQGSGGGPTADSASVGVQVARAIYAGMQGGLR